jgi:hypothetical protein
MSAGGQGAQALPPLPHEAVLLPVSQIRALSQHPVGHVEALQGMAWQMPPPQLSSGGQAEHALPPSPHALVLVPDSQKPEVSQQPRGHVAALHGGPLHAPAEQVSPGGHSRHAAAPVPHAAATVPGSHFPKLSQQPVGQVEALHVAPWHPPALQVSPGGHGVHALPPLPQEAVLAPDSQIPSSQHPVGHVVESQPGGPHAWNDGLHTRPFSEQSLQLVPPLPQTVSALPATHTSPPAALGAQQPWHVLGPQPDCGLTHA